MTESYEVLFHAWKSEFIVKVKLNGNITHTGNNWLSRKETPVTFTFAISMV